MKSQNAIQKEKYKIRFQNTKYYFFLRVFTMTEVGDTSFKVFGTKLASQIHG